MAVVQVASGRDSSATRIRWAAHRASAATGVLASARPDRRPAPALGPKIPACAVWSRARRAPAAKPKSHIPAPRIVLRIEAYLKPHHPVILAMCRIDEPFQTPRASPLVCRPWSPAPRRAAPGKRSHRSLIALRPPSSQAMRHRHRPEPYANHCPRRPICPSATQPPRRSLGHFGRCPDEAGMGHAPRAWRNFGVRDSDYGHRSLLALRNIITESDYKSFLRPHVHRRSPIVAQAQGGHGGLRPDAPAWSPPKRAAGRSDIGSRRAAVARTRLRRHVAGFGGRGRWNYGADSAPPVS